MRFSTCRMSSSPSTSFSRCSSRCFTSNISSTSCFCSSLSGRCAAIVSPRRPASSMPASEVRISGGIFLFSFTYWSNCWIIVRRIASVSWSVALSAGSGVMPHREVRLHVDHFVDARALAAFDQHFHRAVGQLQHLQDVGDAADLVEVLGRRIVLGGRFLRDQHDALPGLHRRFERLDRLRAARRTAG